MEEREREALLKRGLAKVCCLQGGCTNCGERKRKRREGFGAFVFFLRAACAAVFLRCAVLLCGAEERGRPKRGAAARLARRREGTRGEDDNDNLQKRRRGNAKIVVCGRKSDAREISRMGGGEVEGLVNFEWQRRKEADLNQGAAGRPACSTKQKAKQKKEKERRGPRDPFFVIPFGIDWRPSRGKGACVAMVAVCCDGEDGCWIAHACWLVCADCATCVGGRRKRDIDRKMGRSSSSRR